MDTNFDYQAFFDELQATKPPYKCPFKNCDKVYRSFGGIQYHVLHSHNRNGWKPVGKSSKWHKNRAKKSSGSKEGGSDVREEADEAEGVLRVVVDNSRVTLDEDIPLEVCVKKKITKLCFKN